MFLIRGQKVMMSFHFMFQFTPVEWAILKSQFVTSSWGGIRKLPYAFTEQGVAMLSIAIMRAFVKLREILSTHKDLARKLEELEKKYDSQFRVVFEAIRQLMQPAEHPRRRIGFRVKEPKIKYAPRRKEHR